MDVDGLKEVLRRLAGGRDPHPRGRPARAVAARAPDPELAARTPTSTTRRSRSAGRARSRLRRTPARPRTPRRSGRSTPRPSRQVVADAQPVIRDAEELHDALLQLGSLEPGGGDRARALLERARGPAPRGAARRSTAARSWSPPSGCGLVAGALPGAALQPALAPLPGDGPVDARGRGGRAGARADRDLRPDHRRRARRARSRSPRPRWTRRSPGSRRAAQVLRGTFRRGRRSARVEWCDRRLLQRIHRLTVGQAAHGDRAALRAGLHALPLPLAPPRRDRAAARAGRAARRRSRCSRATRPRPRRGSSSSSRCG